MNEEEQIRYLTNIYLVVASDGEVDGDEERLFDSISRDIRAGYGERRKAKELAESGVVQTHVSDRWSDRIRNLEDMMFAAYCNGEIDPAEKRLVVQYAKQLGIDQEQLNQIKQETKRRHGIDVKSQQEEKQRLSRAEIPYGVNKKPMPRGEDINQLLPERVGNFQRKPIPVPKNIYRDQIYASYSAGDSGLWMELGVCDDPAIAREAINTVKAESADITEFTEAYSVGTEPSFLKIRVNNERMGGESVGMAWTRGSYFFSVGTKSEDILCTFMEAFPF